MKQLLKTWIAASSFCLFTAVVYAQNEPLVTPPWASDKGYWVVESNVQTPLHHIVRFYTNGDVLMYTETLTGIKLNINKRNVKMKLKKALEASVVAWLQHKKPEANKDYVKALLK